jgi:hypothetical protein
MRNLLASAVLYQIWQVNEKSAKPQMITVPSMATTFSDNITLVYMAFPGLLLCVSMQQ